LNKILNCLIDKPKSGDGPWQISRPRSSTNLISCSVLHWWVRPSTFLETQLKKNFIFWIIQLNNSLIITSSAPENPEILLLHGILVIIIITKYAMTQALPDNYRTFLKNDLLEGGLMETKLLVKERYIGSCKATHFSWLLFLSDSHFHGGIEKIGSMHACIGNSNLVPSHKWSITGLVTLKCLNLTHKIQP
jgi:hypothetical protein